MDARPILRRMMIALAVCLLALGQWGCPSEELISSVPIEWKMLIAQPSGDQTQLALYTLPKGTLERADVFASANGAPLDGSVAAIEQFRSMLFLVQPAEQRIVVLDAATYRTVATIATTPHSPQNICFANATTGYIAYRDSTIGIVDLTTFTVVRTLTVGKSPRGIAALGNRVAVCNQADGTVSIIDTRSNTVSATVPVAPYPTFVGGGSDPASSFAIVSLGSGKLSPSEQLSPAVLTFYNPFEQSLGVQLELSQLFHDAQVTIPQGLVVTRSATAFVFLDGEVQMVDLAGQRMLGTVVSESPSGGTYDFARNLVLIWAHQESGTRIIALDPVSGQVKGQAILPITVNVAAGL